MAQVLLATALPRLIAAVRRQARPTTIGGLIRSSGVWELMKARGIANTGHNVVIYWDEPGAHLMASSNGIPVDIGAEITEPFESDDQLICTATPAGRMVSAMHVGSYDGLGAAYQTIHAYCRAEGVQLAGPYWEFYGHWDNDPAKLETTVSYLLA
ncbi:MAG: GyrI-like domain-containing protein [Devosia sp.]